MKARCARDISRLSVSLTNSLKLKTALIQKINFLNSNQPEFCLGLKILSMLQSNDLTQISLKHVATEYKSGKRFLPSRL